MARIRTIKPEFWEDEKVNQLPISARLLFIGTWTYADDNGVIRGNPAYLKARIFPYDDNLRVGEVKKWIDALVKARMLIPITFRGESYYVVRTFRSHQRIDTRYSNALISTAELKVLLPLDEDTTSPRRVPDEDTTQEMEVEVDSVKGDVSVEDNTQHTVLIFPKKRVRASDVDAAFDRMTDTKIGWIKGFAPNILHISQQLTRKQFGLLLESYELGDIGRILFDISSRPEVWKKYDSVYAAFSKFASCDRQIQAQRTAIAHNDALSKEGVARGKADIWAVPRTTRQSHPHIGYITELL